MSAPAPSLKTILVEAVDIPDRLEREAFLDRACGGDSDLRAKLERLVADHFRAGSFLESPLLAGEPSTDPPLLEEPHSVIGPYRLMEQIGEGGMGIVYVAEQQQPLRRKVALKIIKPGMDSRQIIARFEAERQALALMDHPNIAKVLDAGTTENGRPYFVMELVKGVPLTDYCDREQLTTRQRLNMFRDVCLAVQHAHQKGIIHRDLKPSNVLVAVHDVTPVVKVIDFGVAKSIGQQLTDKTLYTGIAQLVGTPLYMSPEQAGQSSLDIDTRSDVYSLGVLLYELLTGTTPFDSETFRKVGYDEMRRMIREVDPPKPSTRLSTLEEGKLSTVSARRGVAQSQLGREVRGELDWIVMKCLEKDRERRYDSAISLSRDVERFLANEPVQACPPSMTYRLRKFVRRNRGRVAIAGAILAMVVLVATGSAWMHLEQVRESDRAAGSIRESLAGARASIEAGDLSLAGQRVAEARGRLGTDPERLVELATEVNRCGAEIAARKADSDLLRRFMELATDAQDKMAYGKDLGGDRVAEKALGLYGVLSDDGWQKRLGQTHLTASQKEQVRETVYVTLVSLADFHIRWQFNARESGVRSRDLLRRAEAIHEPTRAFYFVRSRCNLHDKNEAAADEDVRRYRAMEGRTAWDYFLPGHTAGWGGELNEAIRSYEAALRIQPDHYNSLFFLGLRLGTDKIDRRPEAIQLLRACIALRPGHRWAYNNRAGFLVKLGRRDEAESDLTLATERMTTDVERAFALMDRAKFFDESGKPAEARKDSDACFDLCLRIIAIESGRGGAADTQAFVSVSTIGILYIQAGRYDLAIRLLESTLAKWPAQLGPDHVNTMNTWNNVGVAFAHAGRYADAIRFLEPVLEKRRARLGADHEDTLMALGSLAGVYHVFGRFERAEPLYRELVERQRKINGPKSPEAATALMFLGLNLQKQERYADAEPFLLDSLSIRKAKGPRSRETASSLATLGQNLLKQERYADAEPILRECLSIREEKLPDDFLRFHTLSLLGGALLGQKKYAEAEPLLLKAYDGIKQRESRLPADSKLRLPEAAGRVVDLYEATARPDKAAEWREKARPAPSSKKP